MIGLDTNVLIRFLTNDDIRQSVISRNAIATYAASQETCYIGLITFCETLWTLQTRYKYGRGAITEAVILLLSVADFMLEDTATIAAALPLYRQSSADFADILIGLRNRKSGCAATLTFDKQAATLDEFALLA